MEEGGELVSRETVSLIAHGEDHPQSVHPSLNGSLYYDRCLFGRVFDCIGQHILKQLTQPIRVGREDDLHMRVDVDWPFCCPVGRNAFLHPPHALHYLSLHGMYALWRRRT